MPRLARLDWLLLSAVLLTAGIQTFAVPSDSKGKGRASTAWQEQETGVQERIQKVAALDRETLTARIRQDRSLWLRFRLGALAVVAVFLGALLQWMRIGLRLIRRQPPAPPLGSPSPPAWGLRGIVRVCLITVLVIQVSTALERVALRSFPPAWLDLHVLALANTLLVDAVAVAGAWWLFRRAGLAASAQRGLRGLPWRKIRFSLGSYLTCVPLFLFLLMAMAMALRLLRVEPPPQAIFTMYMSEGRGAVLRLLLLLAVLAGPVAEEIFFRGLVYRWLRFRLGVGPGLLVSAFLFALLHTDPVAFLPILGLGLLFGWVYERTGSLAAPIAIHMLHNGAMLYLVSLVKGISSLGGV